MIKEILEAGVERVRKAIEERRPFNLERAMNTAGFTDFLSVYGEALEPTADNMPEFEARFKKFKTARDAGREVKAFCRAELERIYPGVHMTEEELSVLDRKLYEKARDNQSFDYLLETVEKNRAMRERIQEQEEKLVRLTGQRNRAGQETVKDAITTLRNRRGLKRLPILGTYLETPEETEARRVLMQSPHGNRIGQPDLIQFGTGWMQGRIQKAEGRAQEFRDQATNEREYVFAEFAATKDLRKGMEERYFARLRDIAEFKEGNPGFEAGMQASAMFREMQRIQREEGVSLVYGTETERDFQRDMDERFKNKFEALIKDFSSSREQQTLGRLERALLALMNNGRVGLRDKAATRELFREALKKAYYTTIDTGKKVLLNMLCKRIGGELIVA